jgi:hypothetical protein
MSELAIVAETLSRANSYFNVFGELEGDSDNQEHQVKKVYRKLARVLHPDLYAGTPDEQKAEEAFTLLTDYYDQAKDAIANHVYGRKPHVVIRTKRHEHEIGDLVERGDICDLYEALIDGTGAGVLKLAREPADVDLLRAEETALKRLFAADGDPMFYPFLPEFTESFVYQDGAARKQANVLERLDDWYSLEEVHRVYPKGLSPLHMVWIWRRLLWILGYVHERGLIHGAVWPCHIMIHPTEHGLKLVDWCYSVKKPDEGEFTAIKAVVPAYKSWYPKEVLDKQTPTSGTDIFMAVRSMIYLMGGDAVIGSMNDNVPKGIRAFLKGCSRPNQRFRPQEAWLLLPEFDELLERMGPPYWPRKFRTFKMPA